MGELDHAALAESLTNEGAKGLASLRAALGVTLVRTELDALVALCESTDEERVRLPLVLSLLQRALGAEHGIAYERLVTRRRAWVHCLVARWRDGEGKTWVTIALHRTYASAKVARTWTELEPWSKRLDDNRERVETWAKKPPFASLRFAVAEEPLRQTPRASMQGTTDDHSSFLRAIAEAPEDDAPRLVYADWLMERGDAARGELITVQCEHVRTIAPERRTELETRAQAILAASFSTFAGELAPYSRKEWFERGFVKRVRMTIAAFAKHSPRFFTTAPVRGLSVANKRWSEKDLAKLASTPALGLLRELRIEQVDPRSAGLPLARLAESAHLGGLRKLDLFACGHSAEDWEAFFGELRAPELEEVHLSYNRSSAGIFRGLARNPHLERLRDVNEYRFIDVDAASEAELADALAQLTASPHLPALKRLVLRGRERAVRLEPTLHAAFAARFGGEA